MKRIKLGQRELTKAMCSLVYFLRFTGEDFTQFGSKLPTLDTDMWVEGNKIRYIFLETGPDLRAGTVGTCPGPPHFRGPYKSEVQLIHPQLFTV